MGYETDSFRLDYLIRLALDADDIAPEIKKGVVTGKELRSHIENQSAVVWDFAAEEINAASAVHARWEHAKAAAEKEFNEGGREKKTPPLRVWLAEKIPTRFFVPSAYVALLIFALWLIRYFGRSATSDWLRNWRHVAIVAVVLAVAVVTSHTFSRLLRRLKKSVAQTFEQQCRTELSQLAKQLSSKHGVPLLAQEFYQRRSKADEAVLEKAILPSLRTYINERRHKWLEAPYALDLPNLLVPGLAEAFNPSHEVLTAAKAKVLRSFDAMPGGTIAVAGPRGAGKTTLLWAVCNQVNRRSEPKKEVKADSDVETAKGDQKNELLAVMSSAPVQYDAREFVLHLFSSLCRQVLLLNGETEEAAPWRTVHEAQPTERDWLKLLALVTPLSRRLRLLAISLAIMFFTIGSVLLLGALEDRKRNSPPPKPNIQESPVPSSTTNPATPSSPQSNSTTLAEKELSKGSELKRIADILELKPAPFFVYGFWLLVLGILIQAIERFMTRRLEIERRKRRDNVDAVLDQYDEKDPKATLIAAAHRWQREIRFQQSYSSGWSGALKLPIGIEGGINRAVSLAQMQMTLPEIVEGYREFISLAATKYRVVIAIDELDKIESDETAQQFLNELKPIFGIDHCFYLISVSENAMSSFERRGLPFRDAFDSAIDVLVLVDYFDQEAAKYLLRSRVIGLPEPFLTFCYCFSAGLARDLLRVCRGIFDQANLTGERKLTVLVQNLVEMDIQAKLRATAATARSFSRTVEHSLVLSELRHLEADVNDAESLMLHCKNLLNIWRNPHGKQSFTVGDRNGADQQLDLGGLRALTMDLVTYIQYQVTLMEVFGLYSTPSQWKEMANASIFDTLARVRRYLAFDAMTAQSIILEAREDLGLPPLAVA